MYGYHRDFHQQDDLIGMVMEEFFPKCPEDIWKMWWQEKRYIKGHRQGEVKEVTKQAGVRFCSEQVTGNNTMLKTYYSTNQE